VALGSDDALTARITLRLPDSLKVQIDVAASREGVSTNSWIVRALARGLDSRPARSGRRLTGYAES
jgi:predicted HicB family RNase H-like nuclease